MSPTFSSPSINADAILLPAEPATTKAVIRVLVLDDQREIADFLSQLVDLMGYEATAESNPRRALELIEEQEFDLVFTDFRMPEINGEQVYNAAVASRPELAKRIIFLSGDVSNDEMLGFVESVGAISLKKPFHFSNVQDAIAAVLEGPRE